MTHDSEPETQQARQLSIQLWTDPILVCMAYIEPYPSCCGRECKTLKGMKRHDDAKHDGRKPYYLTQKVRVF